MKRMGSHKRPFYRIVAADSRFQRDGRFLEILGYYDPKKDPYEFVVDRDKVMAWLKNGARMSVTVKSLLRNEGIVQAFNLEKLEKSAAGAVKAEESPAIGG
jgi:small subunit ribosomal protein S16